MTSFDEMWRQADPDAVGGEDSSPPAPGVYTATLLDAGAFFSKAGEAFQKMRWGCVEAPNEWTKMFGFKTQGAANFAKKEARSLGVNVDAVSSIEELNAALGARKGSYFEVEVVQNGEYVDTYVRGPVQSGTPLAAVPDQEPPVAQPQPVGAHIPTDDVPF